MTVTSSNSIVLIRNDSNFHEAPAKGCWGSGAWSFLSSNQYSSKEDFSIPRRSYRETHVSVQPQSEKNRNSRKGNTLNYCFEDFIHKTLCGYHIPNYHDQNSRMRKTQMMKKIFPCQNDFLPVFLLNKDIFIWKVKIYRGRSRGRETELFPLLVYCSNEYNSQGWAKSNQEFCWDLPLGCRGPRAWAIVQSLPRYFRRELICKRSSWDLNCSPYGMLSQQRLNLLCHGTSSTK